MKIDFVGSDSVTKVSKALHKRMRLTSIEDDFKNILKEEEQMFSMEDRILE